MYKPLTHMNNDTHSGIQKESFMFLYHTHVLIFQMLKSLTILCNWCSFISIRGFEGSSSRVKNQRKMRESHERVLIIKIQIHWGKSKGRVFVLFKSN